MCAGAADSLRWSDLVFAVEGWDADRLPILVNGQPLSGRVLITGAGIYLSIATPAEEQRR